MSANLFPGSVAPEPKRKNPRIPTNFHELLISSLVFIGVHSWIISLWQKRPETIWAATNVNPAARIYQEAVAALQQGARSLYQLGLWRDAYFWLTFLLSLPASSPLWRPDYHWGAHDARHAVYFLYQFDKVISDGVWYPRWAPDFAFGQGYPFFNIYGPLSSYAGQLFLALGLDHVGAVKMVFGLSVMLSGVAMYGFVRQLIGPQAGLIAGLSYVYLPYHLLDLYVRAALAESVAFVFVPLVFWGIYRATTQPTVRGVILGAVVYAALWMTSNLVALLISPFLGLYTLLLLLANGLRFDIIRRAIPPALIAVLGICLSGIFFLPLIFERQFINLSQWIDGGGRFVYSAFFVEFFQLFSPFWGFGIATPGPDDGMGFQLGLVPVILFVLSFWAIPRIEGREIRLTLHFMQGLVLVITFLTLPVSLPVWEVVPLAALAQFPWRLLVVIAPGLAVLAGAIVGQASPQAGKQTLLNVIPLALLIILAGFPYVRAELRPPQRTEGPVSLVSLFRFQQSANELTGVTRWVEEIPTWSSLAQYVAIGGDITTRVVTNEVRAADGSPLMGVNSFEMDSVHEFVWVFAADDQQTVTFQIPYHPGWTATLYQDTDPDNAETYPYGRIGPAIASPSIDTTSPEGWMTIPVSAGTHFLELRFKNTPIRIIGTGLTFVTAGLMILALIVDARRRKP